MTGMAAAAAEESAAAGGLLGGAVRHPEPDAVFLLETRVGDNDGLRALFVRRK